MNEKLIELAKRCEAATEPDRELDADIWMAVTPGHSRVSRTVKSDKGLWPDYVIDETRDASSRLIIVPFYTESLDAALTLVPEGWFWRAGRTSAFQAWAGVSRTHPDHCDKNDEFFARREYWEPTWTPMLALASAALRARAAIDAEERA